MAGALFYCPKAGLQRRVVRVEGILDGLIYIGGPNHLLYLTQLEYKAIYRRAQAWWTPKVSEAIAAERRAHRQWSSTRTDSAWDSYIAASKAKRQQIASAKQAHWRQSVHEASVSTEGIWRLAKWARTKSHLPPEPAKMPDLQWQGAQLGTVSGKARALYERFYPETEAELQDITDRDFQHDLPGRTLEMSQLVTEEDVQDIVQRVKLDKCPGSDEIPNRFLQAMGEPLIKALQALITAVFKVNYYPKRFQVACTIVL